MTIILGLTQTINNGLFQQDPLLVQNKDHLKTFLLKITKQLIDNRTKICNEKKQVTFSNQEGQDTTFEVSADVKIIEFLEENGFDIGDDPLIIANKTYVGKKMIFGQIPEKHILVKNLDYSGKDGCRIVVQTLTGKEFSVYQQPSDSVASLKMCIQHLQKIPYDQIRLVYSGKQLEDYWDLSDVLEFSKIKPPIVYLLLRLRGGMFHITSGLNDYESLDKYLNSADSETEFLERIRSEYSDISSIDESIRSVRDVIRKL